MNLEPHQIPATESPAVLENTNTPSHDSERLGHSDTDYEKNSTENVVPGPQSLTESGYVTYPSSVDVTVTGSVILEGNTSLHHYYASRNIRPSQGLEETVCNDNLNLPESHGENDAAVHFVEVSYGDSMENVGQGTVEGLGNLESTVLQHQAVQQEQISLVGQNERCDYISMSSSFLSFEFDGSALNSQSGNHWMKSSVTLSQEVALKFKKVKSSCASALSSWPDWNVDDEKDQKSIDSFSENVVMDSHSQGEPQEISDGTKNLNLFTEILPGSEEPQEISEGTENLNSFTEVSDARQEPQEISEDTKNLNSFTEVSDPSKEPQEISDDKENGYCLDESEPVTKLSRDVYHLIGDSSCTLAQRQSPGSDNGLSLIQGIHQANSVSPSAPVHSTCDLRRIFESQFHLHPHDYLMRALEGMSLYSQEGCHGTLRTPLQPDLSTFGLNRHHNADHRLDVPHLSDRYSDAVEPIPPPFQMVRIGEESRSSAEVQRLEAPAGHFAGACHMSVEETDQVEIHDVDLDSHRAPWVENFEQLPFPQPNDIDVAIDCRAHADLHRENILIFNNVARCFHCRVRVPKVQNIPCGHCTFCLICSFRFDPCPTCHCPVVGHEPFTL
ncbi:uncharacterized protein LOC106063101 isoform X1 [Biomphalaria glabrata]|uniref:Uncharacterized protein LOC106063101 isoform X1 n=1 Tax=Biomphalaria glabrata TaxID=6526 RepID=A0A9W3AQI2_BIOGL|nr:uncharacterized protein LOC106063101 isoform X1 [Biomphalaria glabrata]